MADLLAKCDDSIGLIETGMASREEVLAAQAFVKKLGDVYRAIKHRSDQAIIAWIEQNGEIVDGEVRYYVGTETKCKCKSVPQAWKAILAACGGDEDVAVTALSSGAFKPSTAKKMLGAEADKHFDTSVEKDLKTGKPLKKLKGVNTKYLPGQEEEESACHTTA